MTIPGVLVDSPLLVLKAAISPLNLFFCKVAFAPLAAAAELATAELPCCSSSCLSVQPALQRHLTGLSLRTTVDFLAHYLFDTTDILISALLWKQEACGFVWPTPCPRNCITSANLWKIQRSALLWATSTDRAQAQRYVLISSFYGNFAALALGPLQIMQKNAIASEEKEDLASSDFLTSFFFKDQKSAILLAGRG